MLLHEAGSAYYLNICRVHWCRLLLETLENHSDIHSKQEYWCGRILVRLDLEMKVSGIEMTLFASYEGRSPGSSIYLYTAGYSACGSSLYKISIVLAGPGPSNRQYIWLYK